MDSLLLALNIRKGRGGGGGGSRGDSMVVGFKWSYRVKSKREYSLMRADRPDETARL